MQTTHTQIAASAANILRTTLYFWWIAYLRQSKDYWWICHENGNCQDPRLISVWQDFGNLFAYQSLDLWWADKGRHVFESLSSQGKSNVQDIQLITKENLPNLSLANSLENSPANPIAYIAVPVALDLKTAQQAFIAILRQLQQDRIKLNSHCDPLFTPPYQAREIDLKTRKALITSYKIYLLQLYLERLDTAHPLKKWGCYEMGMHLGIAKQQSPKAIDTISTAKRKQNCVRALVCQNKNLAKSIIRNVEVGQFPCRQVVCDADRWTPLQEKAKNEAIADGAWHQPDWLSAEFKYLNPAQSRLLQIDYQSPKEEVISTLNAFSAMPMPFLQTKRPPAAKHMH
jgi:hypothetical protein